MKKEIVKKPDYLEELGEFVRRAYEKRREERRALETKWLLNLNFMLGNQTAVATAGGEILQRERRFGWQQNESYNHIAPIIETRLSKFARVNSTVNVRPASGSDHDVQIARLAGKLIEATQADNDFVSVQAEANYWSEVAGTSFYKVTWSHEGDGGVAIECVPPYEIYPESLGIPDVNTQRSIIQARAYPVEAIRERYGVDPDAEKVTAVRTAFGAGQGETLQVFGRQLDGYATVLEYYARPTVEYPNGRLIIVAGNRTVYAGDLPFENGRDGTRTYPFVRQVAFQHPSSFFGVSLIERLIPIQRAYNAIKNRKHELMNRLTAGVTAVEDGSVDVERLEEEGLAPGTVLVYRQGANPPVPLPAGVVPGELRDEEDRLLSEFYSVGGSGNLLDSSYVSTNISGYALSLLIEQDYTRLSVTTESIRRAVKEIAKQILRLYRAYGRGERILKVSGENGEPEVLTFLGSDLNSDDVITEPDSEMVETPATRRNMVLDLLKLGLLSDDNGNIGSRNKAKALELLGFGNWESARSTDEIHLKKAQMEQTEMAAGKTVEADENDDHELHIQEHALFLAARFRELNEGAKGGIEAHIRSHKMLKYLKQQSEEKQ